MKELFSHKLVGNSTQRLRTAVAQWSCLLLALLSLVPTQVQANENAVEFEIKAALIYKLTHFIEWPKAANRQQLTICSLKQDPITPYLKAIDKQSSNDRKIALFQLDNLNNVDAQCKILYLSKSVLAANTIIVIRHPVLTISDKTGFAKKGGMIEISRRNERLHFRINNRKAQLADIKISAPLLKLATVVETLAPERGEQK